MTVHVVLLRGVNVGGPGTGLKMAAFRDVLESLGCGDVRTYIQSGNAVLRSGRAAGDLAADLRIALTLPNGTHPVCLVLPASKLIAALQANPFPEAVAAPKTLHMIFADRILKPDPLQIEALAAEDERFTAIGETGYLLAPSGFGRSRLAGRIDRVLHPAVVTARNLATVMKLAGIAAELEG